MMVFSKINTTNSAVKRSVKKVKVNGTGNEQDSYLELLFDSNRYGFFDIVEKILSFLDYHSLISVKRCSRTFYELLKTLPGIEKEKLSMKLINDWQQGVPRKSAFQCPGLVTCARIFEDGTRIVCGMEQCLIVFNLQTEKHELILKGSHHAPITCIDVFRCENGGNNYDTIKEQTSTFLLSGSQDGIMATWDLKSGTNINKKQLFGRIESICIHADRVVTAHFGRSYDIGCITVRRIISETNIPVVASIWHDLCPVFCMDFSRDLIAAVEWCGTHNNVHVGNVVLFVMTENEKKNIHALEREHQIKMVANLATIANTTFTCCRFMNTTTLITGGEDKQIRLWKINMNSGLNTEPTAFVRCTHIIGGHDNVIMRLEANSELTVSRDLGGSIIVWNIKSEANKRSSNEDVQEHQSVIKKRYIKPKEKTVTCIAVDDRHLLMGSIGHLDVYDFWSDKTKIDSE